MNPVERTRDSKNFLPSIIKFAVLDSIFALLFALGIYAKFTTDGDAFHPFLNDATNVNTLIVIGAIGMLFCVFKIFTLVLKRGKFKRSM